MADLRDPSDALLNSSHPPQDAGEYGEALQRMLERIPNGWGRWVGFDRGWYGLVTTLDAYLSRLIPYYEIHQMKEKLGGLRFYWQAHWLDPIPAEDQDRERSRVKCAEQLVHVAEVVSLLTCELCGSTMGSLCERGGWYKTLCPEHAAALEYEKGAEVIYG